MNQKNCAIFAMALLLNFLMVACSPQTLIPIEPENTGDEVLAGWNSITDSMSNVLYYGSKQYFAADGYVISRYFGTQEYYKYNTKTDTYTRLCSHIDCVKTECPFWKADRTVFRHFYNGRAYFVWNDLTYPDATKGESITYYHTRIMSYDVTTGEYEEVLGVSGRSDWGGYAFRTYLFTENELYYVTHLPRDEGTIPETEGDYIYSFWRCDLISGNKEVLFTSDDHTWLYEFSEPLFLLNDRFIFGDNELGKIWSVDYSGDNYCDIVPGANGVLALLDAYGTFVVDNYIYFAVPSWDLGLDANGFYAYRAKVDGSKIERVSETAVSWIYVTNNYIYFEGTNILDNAKYTGDYVFGRMRHDGSEEEEVFVFRFSDESLAKRLDIEVSGYISAMVIDRPALIGNCFYFDLSYADSDKPENYPALCNKYTTVKLDLYTGKITECVATDANG